MPETATTTELHMATAGPLGIPVVKPPHYIETIRSLPMGKFGCKCGEVVCLIQSPNPCDGLVVPDRVMDEAANKEVLDLYDEPNVLAAVECPACGRLWIDVGPEDNVRWLAYVPESGRYGAVLRRPAMPGDDETDGGG